MTDRASREAHATLLRINEREMAEWQRDHARAVAAIIGSYSGDIDANGLGAYQRLSAALGEAFDTSYGAFPGDPASPLLRATLTSARRAAMLALRQAVGLAGRYVSAPFLAQLRREVEREYDERPPTGQAQIRV